MINELAFSVGVVALAVLVYRRTGSALGASAYFFCAQFVPALISPMVVARLDQRSARAVLASVYALEVATFLALAWLTNHFSLAPILVLALVSGSLDAAARVIARAAWTAATSESHLLRDANALVNTGFSICFMAGPALGGVLVALSGSGTALLVGAGGYLVSVGIVATARQLVRGSPDRTPTRGRLSAAAKYARREPLIRRLLSLQAAAMVFFAISIPVEVILVQRTLHAGPGSYGVLLAFWGAGAIVGSGIYAHWRKVPSRVLITFGSALLGLGLLLMAVAPSISVAIAGAVIAGGGNGIQLVAVRTALQEAVSERWLALVLSLNESIFQAAPGVGIVVGGVLAALAGPRVALAVAGFGSVVLAVAMWMRLTDGQALDASESASVEDPGSASTATAGARQT